MIKYAARLQDSLTLKPEFAYKLIVCLSIAFVLGVLGAVIMFFYASVMSEASVYRKNFNNGYTAGRDFFEENELLLAGMIKGIEFLPEPLVAIYRSEDNSFRFDFPPAVDGRKGSLILSAKMRSGLRKSNLNIIYMDRAAGVARYVFNANVSQNGKLDEVFKKLAPVDWRKETGHGLQVFQLGEGRDRKSYLFEPISPRLMPNTWLGVEIPHERVQQSLTTAMTEAPELSIKYLILDKDREVVSGVPQPDLTRRSTQVFLNALKNNNDGFESYGAPIFKVFLKKELGGGQRWVVYYASHSDVLWQIRYSLVSGVMIFLAALVSACVVTRYVRRAVFEPAQEQAMQLLEREAFNRTMLDLAPVGICVFSRYSGELLLQSESARAMLASYVKVGDGRSSLREFFMSIPLAGGESTLRTGVTTFTVQDHSPRHLHISVAELHYNDQPVLFFSFVDDSERRHAELMLAAAKETADEANAAKSTFLAMMSHEIRTPLHGVLGTLELLANTPLQPQQHGYLSAIEHSSNYLLHIIDDILDFSKIEADQLTLELSQFNLIQLLEDVTHSFISLARKKNVDVYCCLQPDLPLLIGDRNRLQQVLSNLLSNAVKFTDSGKIVVRLAGCENGAGSVDVRIQVCDSGIGIRKAAQDKLFEPFNQADSSTARRYGGTGLGLAICRKLVALMGGTIELVSEVGLGSSFTLLLELPGAGKQQPISLAGLPAIQVLAGANEQRETLLPLITYAGGQAQPVTSTASGSPNNDLLLVGWPHRPQASVTNSFAGVVWLEPQGGAIPELHRDGWHVSGLCQQGILQALLQAGGGDAVEGRAAPLSLPAQLKPLRVLAVEDHPINQLVLTDQLQQLGCQVTMSADGREALQRWQQGELFDVILTDVNMPELDGYQLTRQLRAAGIDVPIVGVTANAQADEGERCMQAGMDGYLLKPFSLAGLRAALQSVGVCVADVSKPNVNAKLDEIKPTMRDLFISTTRHDWVAMMSALSEGNALAVTRYVHRIKGALATIGAVNTEDFLHLEEVAASGDLSRINSCLVSLKEYLDPILETSS